MQDGLEIEKGPLLGGPAPFFEKKIGESTINSLDFKGKWVIVLSHPDDILPLFKTRTMNYVLCRRKIKVIALGDGHSSEVFSGGNFLKKYLLKHSLTVLDDSDGSIASAFGVVTGDGGCPGEEMGTFVIDPGGLLRIKLYTALPAERNFYEILRLVDALQGSDRQRVRQPDQRGFKGLGIAMRGPAVKEV